MKKVFLSVATLIALAFTGCKSENTFNETSSFEVDPTAFQGDITSGIVKLDAGITYKLTGALKVQEGATLTIPAGTTIEASGGTSAYIAIAKGATININGTATSPVVMTSSVHEPGAWGGLVICGDAVTNTGVDVLSEVGGLNYGGANNADSSGSVTYLRVEYTGAKFSATKEFNGVSLFAVGSGTVFENVSSVNGSDDGIEFFGGAVNAKNLVSINSEDDSIDFADGFTGSIDGVYISGVTKAGFEGSNNGSDGNRTPVTTAVIKNASIVANGLVASEGAIYFKEGGGNITYENIYVDGFSLGVKVKSGDAPAVARIEANDLVVNPIQFVNSRSNFDAGVASVITEGNNNGAGNGADLPTWAQGWSEGGVPTAPTSTFNVDPTDLQGDIEDGIVTLNASITYKLTGALVVKSGATLTIPEGTMIEASGAGTSAYIAVAKGAIININGTATNPVVMTSVTKASGAWGGLVICGDAATNVGVNALSEVGGLTYGGTNNEDSSGSITYLRVEYTGAKFSTTKEFNGVSLFAVGSGTKFENVSSVNGGDDGIEFFGGAVNAKNLVAINSEDDSIDFADGFTGTIDGVYIKGVTKAGIEGSNNGADGNKTPVTTTTIKNVSIVDGGLGSSEGAIYFKEGGGNITYQNVYVDGIALGVKVKSTDAPAVARIAANALVINPIQFANKPANFDLGVASAITEGDNTGAGNGADVPTWAAGWAE